MPNYDNITAPISLIGYERSGTSFISRVFQHHPDVDEVGETANAIFSTASMIGEIKGLTRFNDAKAVSAASDLVRHAFLRLFPSHKIEWIQKPIGLPRVFGREFGYDKFEEFSDWYWAVFYAAFPASRTFSIIRHPYDVFISARKYWNFTDEEIWKTQIAMLKLLCSPQANLKIVLPYQSLVDEPEAAVRQLCEKVGISFHEKMLLPTLRLHAPEIGRRFGSQAEFARRQSEKFTRQAQWDEVIPKDPLAHQALDQYHVALGLLAGSAGVGPSR